jgi:prepilin-type N-terminal cleavage/methylation domain-containing protein
MKAMKMNKKGFSLIEVIVAVAIMAVLAAVLVPSLMVSRNHSNEKMDKSAIKNFETSMIMAFQNNSIYKDAKSVADGTYDNTITIVCGANDEKMFEIKELKTTSKTDGLVTDAQGTEAGNELAALRADIEDFINGNVEPIKIQSEFYMKNLQYFIIKFPDVDFKVQLVSETGEETQISDPSTDLGSPSRQNGAEIDENGRWKLTNGQGLHLHTNQQGLSPNKKGDIWKIAMTGEELDGLQFGFAYYDTSKSPAQWVPGGSEILDIVQNGSSVEIRIKSQVAFPCITIEIYNRSDDTTIIDNVQFTKVNEN